MQPRGYMQDHFIGRYSLSLPWSFFFFSSLSFFFSVHASRLFSKKCRVYSPSTYPSVWLCDLFWPMEQGISDRSPLLSLDLKRCFHLQLASSWEGLSQGISYPLSLGPRMNSCESGLPQLTAHHSLQHQVGWQQPNNLKLSPTMRNNVYCRVTVGACCLCSNKIQITT